MEIIIIDNNKFIAKDLEFGLRQHNIQCCIAQNINKGIELIKERLCCLIILELVLSSENGFEFLEKRARDKDLLNIPVFIYSVLSQKSDKEKAIALGAAEYWPKSEYPPEEIIKKVAEFVAVKLIDK